MTAILLCENVLDLNQSVTVQESDRMPPLLASGYNFVAGDVLTLRDLLQCMLTESSCTSAMVIARVVGGILLDRDANVQWWNWMYISELICTRFFWHPQIHLENRTSILAEWCKIKIITGGSLILEWMSEWI